MRHNPSLVVLFFCLVAGRSDAGSLRVQLRDAESGEPTAARVQIVGPSGPLFTAPDATLLTHSWSRIGSYVHAEDELLLAGLAPGTYTVSARRGPNGLPSSAQVAVGNGLSQLELWFEDWVDPRSFGWFGGDPHVHGRHEGGETYPPLDGAAVRLAAAAEGLDLVFSLDNDPEAFAGPRALSGGVGVHWGIEYRNGWWGHVALLGLPSAPTSTGCCGFQTSGLLALSSALPPLAAGLAVLAHPHTTDTPHLDGTWPAGGHAREAAAVALYGAAHGFAVGSASNGPNSDWALADYLDLVRTGARLSAVGESDAALDRYLDRPPGFARTYARLAAAPAPDDPGFATLWLSAVRAGRSYASDGPLLLECSLGSRQLGETLALVAGASAPLHLRVVSELGLHHVRVHGQSGLHQSWSWSSNGPVDFEQWIDLSFGRDDFVLIEVEASAAHGLTQLVSSPIWVDTAIAAAEPVEAARRAVDALRELLFRGEAKRGYSSASEELTTRALVSGAADAYEAMADDPPGPFQLLYPAAGQILPSTAATFRWRRPRSYDGEAQSFELWLADDDQFTSATLAGVTADSFLSVSSLPMAQDIYWRVHALEPGEAPRANDGPDGWTRVSANPVAVPAPARTGFELGPILADARGLRLRVTVQQPLEIDFTWYDARGRSVRRLSARRFAAGTHEVVWDGLDQSGARVSAATYWVEARSSGGQRETMAAHWLPR